MLRKSYLLLILVRLYLATVPSYIHPDEHFQGPEVITGEVFGWPSYKTWEFTSSQPIRSIFPLWLVYGPSLTIYKWICEGTGYEPTPTAVFYVLRVLMFMLSFVLEDWALYELLPVKRERAVALMMVASSYVTCTFQMHTFSNSIETIVVLWCLVLMGRMKDNSEHTQVRLCVALAFLGVVGIFNRITFPAFLLVAGIGLLPHLLAKPLRIPIIISSAALISLVAIAMDTEHYTDSRLHLRQFHRTAIITPWNNLLYNLDSTNLAQHGLHPYYLHFLANLPQLLGPAIPLLLFSSRKTTLFWSGIVGTLLLSCFQHQEARFLLPAVPLLLASIKLPSAKYTRPFVAVWLIFNTAAATLFGIYHQAGVVPVQNWIAQQEGVSQVFWWKTYSPPRWLLGARNGEVETVDLMGMSIEEMVEKVVTGASCSDGAVLVAPTNALGLEAKDGEAQAFGRIEARGAKVDVVWKMQVRGHIGLDDLDFGDDGVLPTLKRVIGGRGLTVWQILKRC